MLRRAVALAVSAVILGFVPVWPAPRAQDAARSSADTTATIDRLIKEADDALTAGSFDAMATAAASAVTLSRASGGGARLAQSLLRLGQAHFYHSRNDEALAAHREVVDIAGAINDPALRARGLNGVGLALRELGEYDQAIDFLSQALDAHRASGDRLEQVRVQRNIAVLYWQLGDLGRAEATARAAADLAHAIGNKPFETITLQAYGAIVADAGRRREALAIEQRALAIAQELKMPVLLIELDISIGDTLRTLGERERALASFKAALDASERAGYVAGQAVAVAHIGETYRQLGQTKEALDWLLRARAQFGRLGDTTHLANVVANEFHLAQALRDDQRLDEALATFRAAIDTLDRIRRAAVPTEATTASVNAARTDLFVSTASLLIDRHRPAEAFEIAERYHARAFLDSLAAARADIRQTLSAAERERERDLLARATRLQNELWTSDLAPARRRLVDAELAAVDDEFERLAGSIRRRSPGYAIHYPPLLDAAAVQRELVDDRTVLVEYLVGDRESFVWAISRREVHAAALGDRTTLEPLIDRYRQALSTRASLLTLDRSLRELARASADLYAAIIAPIESALTGAERVIIVADGPLAYVPFEPLQPRAGADRTSLVDRFDISYAPSASALFALGQMEPTTTPAPRLLAIGAPVTAPAENSASTVMAPLPFSGAEVRAISAVFRPGAQTIYLGADASEDAVKAARLTDYQYVHFATHGILDPANPTRSGLVLAHPRRSSDDGVLRTREIMRLQLNADMVTLSACETGLGSLVNGEGVLGMTRAFFYAGARSVVVSLWDVNDGATAELMRLFYAGIQGGLDRDAALRAAKRTLAHGPRRLWRHPYFWAPFVFTGSSR